jgi:hypothetical protein
VNRLPAALLLAALGTALGACASKPAESNTVLLPKNSAKPEEVDPKKHVHVWEPVEWQVVEDWSSGIPMTEIQYVYRCKECGAIRGPKEGRR